MASRRRHGRPGGNHLLSVIDRAKSELELLRTQAEGSRSDATLLAAAVAHEIRNVLSPVRAYAQLALACPGDGLLVERALAAASAGAQRATLISEMIIDAARGLKGGSGADIGRAVQQAIALLPPDPNFHVQHPQTTALTAPISQTGLEHVLLNLLLNAKAACGGHGVASISAVVARRQLVISVADDGSGIKPARLDTIFSPFVSESRGGRGLGLTVCRFLVEAAGGSISASSASGRGSCFNIYFPAAACKQAA